MKSFISKYSGKQVDQVISGVLSMRPRINVTGAIANSTITCSSEEISNPIIITTDSTGSGVILISRYGIYNVTNSNIVKNIYIDEFKQYEMDFSDVSDLPVITAQPQNVTVSVGDTATLTLAAENSSSYQWQYYYRNRWNNNTATGYNTNTMTFTATSSINGRRYRCIVSNYFGSIISNELILTVTS